MIATTLRILVNLPRHTGCRSVPKRLLVWVFIVKSALFWYECTISRVDL